MTPRTQRIVRLNEAVLLQMGFDPVTVKALANMARVTGPDDTGPTVPQVGEKTDRTAELVVVLQDQVAVIEGIIQLLQTEPADIPFDRSAHDSFALLPVQQTVPETVHIVTEMRQIAEAVANLREYLQTEVRQLAEQQYVIANQIQDIKQGMTP